jgi:hypothetical protein
MFSQSGMTPQRSEALWFVDDRLKVLAGQDNIAIELRNLIGKVIYSSG